MQSLPSTPGLIRKLRNRYKAAIRTALSAADLDDIPDHGPALLGLIVREPKSAVTIATALSLSKQGTSQLIDALVVRGYAERAGDPEDRRRIRVAPTARGLDAARITRDAVRSVDAACVMQVGAEAFDTWRGVLAALAEGQAP